MFTVKDEEARADEVKAEPCYGKVHDCDTISHGDLGVDVVHCVEDAVDVYKNDCFCLAR